MNDMPDFVDYPREPMAIPRPWWVRVTMVGLKRRNAVLACGWFAVLVAFASLIAAIFSPIRLVGIGMLLAAWPYFATVRWMDKTGSWN